ncbi:cyclin-dependent protein kinase inhibitor SMR6-like [Salvia hispanica]|uniref:cyclin-dependent protein kinase inhibitor SMR6-like n=1 Tax=Salvia hispanica TaxID=49212 RepID=UPI0020098EA6|nr:cyclin-dependent protein kinase inhibitor SMR6-like [Salvia hispanica]
MSSDRELSLPMIKTSNSTDEIGGNDDEFCRSEDCQTPRSPRHMIPAVLRCPPAPKKRRQAAACKRKLCELEFFAGEEIESLFRIVEVNNSCDGYGSAKRNCFI